MRQYYSESVLAQRIYGPPEIRFWAKVRRGGPDECWLWLAHRDTKGYGKFGITDAISKKAHRYAYELLVEPIPDGLTLDHLCRNRGCVNPDHLVLAPQYEGFMSSVRARAARRAAARREPD